MLEIKLLEVETNLLVSSLKSFEDKNDIMCECGREKAKYKVYDDFMKGWHMNLCDDCLLDIREDYEEEGTSYKVSLLK